MKASRSQPPFLLQLIHGLFSQERLVCLLWQTSTTGCVVRKGRRNSARALRERCNPQNCFCPGIPGLLCKSVTALCEEITLIRPSSYPSTWHRADCLEWRTKPCVHGRKSPVYIVLESFEPLDKLLFLDSVKWGLFQAAFWRPQFLPSCISASLMNWAGHMFVHKGGTGLDRVCLYSISMKKRTEVLSVWSYEGDRAVDTGPVCHVTVQVNLHQW